MESNDILNAAKELNISISLLSSISSQEILQQVIQKYTALKEYEYPLWEALKPYSAVTNEYAWEWFEELLPSNTPLVIFFESADDENMIQVPSSSELVTILNNTYRKIFFITTLDTDILYCYNDHDNLIACGAAKGALKGFYKVSELGLEVFEQ